MSSADRFEALREADARARALAVTRFDAPLMLEAGAGTGKTTTLVARLLAWSLGPGWERHAQQPTTERRARAVLRGIAAITFTEAAAAEMSERFAASLQKLANGAEVRGHGPAALPPPEELQARATALLGAADGLPLTTIHAFGASLLRRFGLSVGLHPRAEVDADEERVQEQIQELIEERLPTAFGDAPDAHWITLARLGKGPRDIAEGLLELHRAGVRPEELRRDPLDPERIEALILELRAPLLPLSHLLSFSEKLPKNATAIASARELIQCLAAEVYREDVDLAALASGDWETEPPPEMRGDWPGKFIEQVRKWAKGDCGKKLPKILGEDTGLLEQLCVQLQGPIEELARLDVELLRAGHGALAPLYAELRSRLRHAGVLSFDDLLGESVALLEQQPAALERLRDDLDFLAVDEFQDTDRRQCRLVELLALSGDEATRPALFVVGDPKQSIYGWRAADLKAYDGFKQLLSAAGGEVCPLVVNYRSDQRILDEVERVMRGAMHAEYGLQPAFEPLVAGREIEVDPASPCVELAFQPPGERGRNGQVRIGPQVLREADWIAASIRGWVAELEPRPEDKRAPHFGDVALLLRSTSDLDRYVDAFKRFDVPFAVVRDKSYYRRREVIEAGALVRCVLDPRDQVALVTWVRSGLIGVPDAALLPLWNVGLPQIVCDWERPDPERAGQAQRAIAQAAEAMPAGHAELERWPRALLAGLEDLAALRARYREASSERFVEFLRQRTLLEPGEAGRFLGAYRSANLERFFRQLEQAIEEAAGDRARVLRKLRESVAQSLEAEEARPRASADNAVQVMTVHKSKGLDFRTVVTGQLYKGAAPKANTKAFSFGQGPQGLEWRAFGTPSLGWHHVDRREQEVSGLERVRLLYVAMTRAKDRLVMACSEPFASEAKPARAAKSLDQILALREPPLERPETPLHQLEAGVRLLEVPLVEPPAEPATARPEPAAAERWTSRARRDAELLEQRAGEVHARLSAVRTRPISDAAGQATAAASAKATSEELELYGVEPTSADAHGRAAGGTGARLLGTLVHQELERFARAQDDPTCEQVCTAIERAAEELAAASAPELAADLRARSTRLVAALRAGPLLEQLAALRGQIVAVELPVLLAADPASDPQDAPLEGYTGALDLLLRDDEGTLTVVDYKTDPLGSAEQTAELTAAYRPQLELYARAVERALQPTAPVRAELWLLDSGERIAL